MPSLGFKRTVCRELCRAVREESFEDLEAGAAKHGLRVEQAWRAPSGQGFKAAAARFTVDGEDVLVVAFRSTFGNDEWLEYPQKYWKRKFLPHDGKERDTDLKVFTVWSETLDEVSPTVVDNSSSAQVTWAVDRRPTLLLLCFVCVWVVSPILFRVGAWRYARSFRRASNIGLPRECLRRIEVVLSSWVPWVLP